MQARARCAVVARAIYTRTHSAQLRAVWLTENMAYYPKVDGVQMVRSRMTGGGLL